MFAKTTFFASCHTEMTVTFDVGKISRRKYRQTNALDQGFLMVFFDFFDFFFEKLKKLKILKFKIEKSEIVTVKKITFFTEKHAETHFDIIKKSFLVEIPTKNEYKVRFFNTENQKNPDFPRIIFSFFTIFFNVFTFSSKKHRIWNI